MQEKQTFYTIGQFTCKSGQTEDRQVKHFDTIDNSIWEYGFFFPITQNIIPKYIRRGINCVKSSLKLAQKSHGICIASKRIQSRSILVQYLLAASVR